MASMRAELEAARKELAEALDLLDQGGQHMLALMAERDFLAFELDKARRPWWQRWRRPQVQGCMSWWRGAA